jgi:hypothetical protein
LNDATRARIAVSREADGAGQWSEVQGLLTEGTEREVAYREALLARWGGRSPTHVPAPPRTAGPVVVYTGPSVPCQRCAGTGTVDIPSRRRCPECFGNRRVPA